MDKVPIQFNGAFSTMVLEQQGIGHSYEKITLNKTYWKKKFKNLQELGLDKEFLNLKSKDDP